MSNRKIVAEPSVSVTIVGTHAASIDRLLDAPAQREVVRRACDLELPAP